MSVRRASTQLLAQRSVHIRIVPRPANIGESREIFRILQRFGELTMYKNLRYEYHNPAHNIALAIYREADSAQQAITNSPLRFSIDVIGKDNEDGRHKVEEVVEKNPFASDTPNKDGIDEMLKPSTLANRATSASTSKDPFFNASRPTKPTNPLNPIPTTPPPMPFAPNPSLTPRTTHKKYFQITLDRSRVIHQDFVERQPYWKQFDPTKSMAQEDLKNKVPHIGLSDVSKRPPGAHRTPNDVLKKMNYYVEHHMPSLVDMWEEGEKKKTETDRSL